jgi:hypothetical protein
VRLAHSFHAAGGTLNHFHSFAPSSQRIPAGQEFQSSGQLSRMAKFGTAPLMMMSTAPHFAVEHFAVEHFAVEHFAVEHFAVEKVSR